MRRLPAPLFTSTTDKLPPPPPPLLLLLLLQEALDCADCRILLRSKDPPGKLLTVDYSTTHGLSQIVAVPTAGLGG